jgi:hypothetical protein
MKASTEPLPLEVFNDTSKKYMYRAALVLYHVVSDDQIRKAIEELEKEIYSVENLGIHACETLLCAMQEAHYDPVDTNIDSEEDLTDALADGMGAVWIPGGRISC